MTAQHPILSRLETGRPLLVSGDAEASLRARGVALRGPLPVGRLLRENPSLAVEYYHQQIAAGVDVLTALTADTIPRALGLIGMPFRSAALTGTAVELALDAAEAAPRPLIVAGVLGSAQAAPTAADRMTEDFAMHATRLAASGCELILARGFGQPGIEPGLGRIARRAAVVSAATTGLPTWAVIDVHEGGVTADAEPADEAARSALDAGAHAVVFELAGLSGATTLLDKALRAFPGTPIGFAPGAPLAADSHAEIEAWAAGAKRLVDAGARIAGGGPGTTARHLAALAALLRGPELRGPERQSFWPRAG